MRDDMSASLSSYREARLQHDIPGSDLARPGKSLYAHVRDTGYGRTDAKSQERGRQKEPTHESLLQQ
jgi:hypothetical protein